MKNLLKTLLASLALLTVPMFLNGQNIDENKLLQQRAKERVRLMNDYVSWMADKRNPEDERKYYRTEALPLFIGKGYEYKENGTPKKGVMMQTTSVNKPGIVNATLIRDYFTRLTNLKYTSVNITSTEIADIKVSDLKKIDSNLYECTCQYVQYFRGQYGDGYVYKDKTTKRIKCYVEVEEVEPDSYGNRYEYMVMLGDVEAISTERIE